MYAYINEACLHCFIYCKSFHFNKDKKVKKANKGYKIKDEFITGMSDPDVQHTNIGILDKLFLRLIYISLNGRHFVGFEG